MNDFSTAFDKIKLILFDVEGVLLKNKEKDIDSVVDEIYNKLLSFCDFAKEKNIKVGLVTASAVNKLLKKVETSGRCLIVKSALDKVSKVKKVIEKEKLNFDEVFYIGDDLLDIPLLKKVGISSAPSNSRREVKRAVDIVLKIENGSLIFDEVEKLFKS